MILDDEQFTVLGADGFVGRHLTRYLRGSRAAVAARGRGETLDFTRPMGHVFYCIGLTADYLDRPFDTVEAHVSLFSRLLREGNYTSVVYLSSTRLYDSGNGAGQEEDDLILNPGNRRHLYDFSKGLGESLCQVCAPGRARVARLSCVYADALDTGNFLHTLVADALGTDQLALKTHPDAARDYVHMGDVCEALAAIALRGRRPVYNVASGTNFSNRALFDIVERCTATRITTIPTEDMPPAAPRIDIAALREDFDLSPRRIEDYLPGLIAQHRPASPARWAAS